MRNYFVTMVMKWINTLFQNGTNKNMKSIIVNKNLKLQSSPVKKDEKNYAGNIFTCFEFQ